MSAENLLWGAPRIHGELLKLGLAVAQSTVAKYMVRKSDHASKGWEIGNKAFNMAAGQLENCFCNGPWLVNPFRNCPGCGLGSEQAEGIRQGCRIAGQGVDDGPALLLGG